AAGTILVKETVGGVENPVVIAGGAPTIANTTLIQVFGQDGNDTLALDETNGALPKANLFGGAGNDTLTLTPVRGSVAPQPDGGADSDTFVINGTAGTDVLT